MLAIELPISEEDLDVETQAFETKKNDKCSVIVGEEVGD